MCDPEAGSAPPPGAKGEVRILEPDRLQRTIARRSAEARATVPHLELGADVDMEAAMALREREGYALTSILVRACALALREVPQANSAYRDGRYELYSRINVGVMIATGEAYTIPTVFDCDRKPIAELDEELRRLADEARAGTLAPGATSGATFTVSNPGGLGVRSVAPVIVPPHAAALAAGRVREIPAVRDAAIVPGKSMSITLACDHRILYGSQAAQFLTRIQKQLEEATL
jgi:pyruvate dehydrogenase E2 component (dihydrolipoyllysine-residue acetyltransferase)